MRSATTTRTRRPLPAPDRPPDTACPRTPRASGCGRCGPQEVVLAQGALEKPLVFDGNDRPGVMLAGRRPDLPPTATACWSATARPSSPPTIRPGTAASTSPRPAEAGRRRRRRPRAIRPTERARALGIERCSAHRHRHLGPAAGPRSLASTGMENGGLAPCDIACDAVLMRRLDAVPASSSATQGAARLGRGGAVLLRAPRPRPLRRSPAPAAGLWGHRRRPRRRGAASRLAARDAGHEATRPPPSPPTAPAGVTGAADRPRSNLPRPRPSSTSERRHRQGHPPRRPRRMRSIEHVKRYTTNGMATDQGKTSNINGLMIAADALGKPPSVGLTTFPPARRRPSAFAGYQAAVRGRATPIDPGPRRTRRRLRGSRLARAPLFPAAGEDMHAAVRANAARPCGGIFDASTLGKIEVVGRTPPTFMERMYTNPWAKLGVGAAATAPLLGEDGFIRDDGVIGRPGRGPLPRHHHHRRRGARARHDGGLPPDRVARPRGLADLDHRAVGRRRPSGPECAHARSPSSRARPLGRRFPHMSVAECKSRVSRPGCSRVSFTGELGFEVNVPARHGRALWES